MASGEWLCSSQSGLKITLDGDPLPFCTVVPIRFPFATVGVQGQ